GIDNGLLFEIANLYLEAGDNEKYKSLALDIEKTALASIERNPEDVKSYYNPYRLVLETYENLREYEKAVKIWEKLGLIFPDDPSIKSGIEKYKQLAAQKDSLSK
ncbi:MAG: DUF2723 domain-containing protein, partial [Bacteroidetes bacterium]|nr:DUF2723 domain-containing protein [Bacteroidota bacterium]